MGMLIPKTPYSDGGPGGRRPPPPQLQLRGNWTGLANTHAGCGAAGSAHSAREPPAFLSLWASAWLSALSRARKLGPGSVLPAMRARSARLTPLPPPCPPPHLRPGRENRPTAEEKFIGCGSRARYPAGACSGLRTWRSPKLRTVGRAWENSVPCSDPTPRERGQQVRSSGTGSAGALGTPGDWRGSAGAGVGDDAGRGGVCLCAGVGGLQVRPEGAGCAGARGGARGMQVHRCTRRGGVRSASAGGGAGSAGARGEGTLGGELSAGARGEVPRSVPGIPRTPAPGPASGILDPNPAPPLSPP